MEERFSLAIALIFFLKPNIQTLAEFLHVSRPTVVRIVNELRSRGNIIIAIHDSLGWRYEARRVAAFYLPKSEKSVNNTPVE